MNIIFYMEKVKLKDILYFEDTSYMALSVYHGLNVQAESIGAGTLPDSRTGTYSVVNFISSWISSCSYCLFCS